MAGPLMFSCGAPSLSVMVPVPTTGAAFCGVPADRVMVSLLSPMLSSTVGTRTVKLVTPAGTLTVGPATGVQLAPPSVENCSPSAMPSQALYSRRLEAAKEFVPEIRPLTRPFEGLFDTIVAAELATDANGRCTGYLSGPPMVGESRSAWLTHYAALHDIDLSQSYGYADSHVDLPMLTAIGNPVAVSPDIGLMRAAKAKGWSIVEWPAMSPLPRWRMS